MAMNASYWTKRRRIRARVEERLQSLQTSQTLQSQSVEDQHQDNVTGINYDYSDDQLRHEEDSCLSFHPTERVSSPNLPQSPSQTVTNNDVFSGEEEVTLVSDTDSSDGSVVTDIADKLSDWAVCYQISHAALAALLSILRCHDLDLPKDPRTLLGTCQDYDIKTISGGKYFHFGLEKEILKHINKKQDITSIPFQINIDGLPIFKSSSMQFWPILGRFTEDRAQEPFIVGLYYGQSKPHNIEEYLHDFVDELFMLERNGITCNGKHIDVKLSCVICDTPARSFVKRVKGHTGYFGCDKCTQKGEWKGRMTFPEINAPKRSDIQFDELRFDNHHTGVSPLSRLSIGMVSQFPLDYMHLVCLGVMKKLLLLWIRGPVATGCRIGANACHQISENLEYCKQYIPVEFCRKGRGLGEIDRWKATEFRLFLLYTGQAALSGILSSRMYRNFLLFFVGIFCLASPDLCQRYCDYANDILCYFVRDFAEIYGSEMVVYNVHGITHLAADVKNFGSLDNFSGFCFESYLGKIKKMLRTPNCPLQQVIRRFSEKQARTKPALKTRNRKGELKGQHCQGPLLRGTDIIGMYLLVAFKEDGDVAVVPETWMTSTGEKCYWPPFKNQQKIIKSVRDNIEPDKGRWTLYDVRVMYSNTSYEKTRKKLPMAEETSDLYTEDEEREMRKRKYRPTSRYLSSSDEDEVSQEKLPKRTDTTGLPLPKPPVAKPLPPPPSSCRPHRVVADIHPLPAPPLPLSQGQNSPLCSPPSSPQSPTPGCSNHAIPLPRRSYEWGNLQRGAYGSQDSNSPRRSPRLTSMSRRENQRAVTPPRFEDIQEGPVGSRRLSQYNNPSYVRPLMTAIESNTAKVEENTRLLQQLIRIVSASSAAVQVTGPTIDLPLTSKEDLIEAEQALADPQTFRNVVDTLGVKGGANVKESVSRILSECIAHQLAVKISWNGSSEKTSFKGLSKLKNAVIRATRKNPALKSATDADIEQRIQLWFRYAADREGGKQARMLKKLQRQNSNTGTDL